MKYAIKKQRIITAYQLGTDSEMEKLLIEEGAIEVLSDGRYALFSQESVNGEGQIAEKGDYFKVDTVDGKHYPYPNKKDFFEKKHKHISEDQYEQINRPLAVWQYGDPMCDVIQYLLETGKMTINEADEAHYFNAFLWGAHLSAPKDSIVVFYNILRNNNGMIENIEFNFIAPDMFRQNYEKIL